jgi:vacuolar-type H+-ATPase catalytic subunit A/Vma1
VSLAVLDASFVRKKGGGVAVGGRLGIGKILLKKGGTPA